MKISSVFVFQGGSASLFFLKIQNLWAEEGVSGVVFTVEGA